MLFEQALPFLIKVYHEINLLVNPSMQEIVVAATNSCQEGPEGQSYCEMEATSSCKPQVLK